MNKGMKSVCGALLLSAMIWGGSTIVRANDMDWKGGELREKTRDLARSMKALEDRISKNQPTRAKQLEMGLKLMEEKDILGSIGIIEGLIADMKTGEAILPEVLVEQKNLVRILDELNKHIRSKGRVEYQASQKDIIDFINAIRTVRDDEKAHLRATVEASEMEIYIEEIQRLLRKIQNVEAEVSGFVSKLSRNNEFKVVGKTEKPAKDLERISIDLKYFAYKFGGKVGIMRQVGKALKEAAKKLDETRLQLANLNGDDNSGSLETCKKLAGDIAAVIVRLEDFVCETKENRFYSALADMEELNFVHGKELLEICVRLELDVAMPHLTSASEGQRVILENIQKPKENVMRIQAVINDLEAAIRAIVEFIEPQIPPLLPPGPEEPGEDDEPGEDEDPKIIEGDEVEEDGAKNPYVRICEEKKAGDLQRKMKDGKWGFLPKSVKEATKAIQENKGSVQKYDNQLERVVSDK